MKKILCCCLVISQLIGCGQTGALYLPEKNAIPVQSQSVDSDKTHE